MRAYFIKRLLAIIPTLIFATLIVFFLVRLVPGDIIDLMVSQHDVSEVEVTRKTLEKALGLDVVDGQTTATTLARVRNQML